MFLNQLKLARPPLILWHTHSIKHEPQAIWIKNCINGQKEGNIWTALIWKSVSDGDGNGDFPLFSCGITTNRSLTHGKMNGFFSFLPLPSSPSPHPFVLLKSKRWFAPKQAPHVTCLSQIFIYIAMFPIATRCCFWIKWSYSPPPPPPQKC